MTRGTGRTGKANQVHDAAADKRVGNARAWAARAGGLFGAGALHRTDDGLQPVKKGAEPAGVGPRPVGGGLAVLLFTAPMVGCSLFNKDEDSAPDTPADKLYN